MTKDIKADPQDKSEGGRRRYSSPLMAERRLKILNGTMALIEEKGIANVTIQEISERAGVAQKTLYNILGDRDAIVALALTHAQEGFFSQFIDPVSPTIDDVLKYMSDFCDAFMTKSEQTEAAVAVYFSPNIDDRVYRSLVSLANMYVTPFINHCHQTGMLAAWAPVEMIKTHFANIAHTVSNDMYLGRTPEHQYSLRTNFALLMILIPFIIDPLRQQLIDRLETITGLLAEPG